MSFDWQMILVGASVAWALSYLAWRGYRLLHEPGTGACGAAGCHDCPAGANDKPQQMIQLESFLNREGQSSQS